MAALEVSGTEDFLILAKAIRKYGSKELKREFFRGMNRATKPMRANVKKQMSTYLPDRGGLVRDVKRGARLSTTARGGGRWAGVRIMGRGKHDIRSMNRGIVRHPVYGRPPWVVQRVEPGWFDEPLLDDADIARGEIVKVMNDVTNKIARTL